MSPRQKRIRAQRAEKRVLKAKLAIEQHLAQLPREQGGHSGLGAVALAKAALFTASPVPSESQACPLVRTEPLTAPTSDPANPPRKQGVHFIPSESQACPLVRTEPLTAPTSNPAQPPREQAASSTSTQPSREQGGHSGLGAVALAKAALPTAVPVPSESQACPLVRTEPLTAPTSEPANPPREQAASSTSTQPSREQGGHSGLFTAVPVPSESQACPLVRTEPLTALASNPAQPSREQAASSTPPQPSREQGGHSGLGAVALAKAALFTAVLVPSESQACPLVRTEPLTAPTSNPAQPPRKQAASSTPPQPSREQGGHSGLGAVALAKAALFTATPVPSESQACPLVRTEPLTAPTSNPAQPPREQAASSTSPQPSREQGGHSGLGAVALAKAALPTAAPVPSESQACPLVRTEPLTAPISEPTKPPKPPISPAQLNANRANAQLSSGPKTAAGLAITSQNRTVHGLARHNGAFRLLTSEDPNGFEALKSSLTSEHQPQTETESLLVQSMAESHWLSQRAQTLLDTTTCPDTGAVLNEKLFTLYMRYQTTHTRAFHKSLNDLLKLRKEKHTAEVGFEAQKRRAEELRIRSERHEMQKRYHDSEIVFKNAKACGQIIENNLQIHLVEQRNPGFEAQFHAELAQHGLKMTEGPFKMAVNS